MAEQSAYKTKTFTSFLKENSQICKHASLRIGPILDL